QVQVTLEVTHRHVAGEHFRCRQLTASHGVVGPQGAGRALVDAFDGTRGFADVDVAVALGDTHIAGGITLPQHAAAFQVQARYAALVGADVQGTTGQQQTTVD